MWEPPHTSSLVWPGACTIVRRALAPSNISRRSKHHEETKGFLSYRVADSRGDHSDHRGYCHSEPAPVPYGRERGFGSGFSPHDQYGGSYVLHDVSHGWFRDAGSSRRRGTLHHRDIYERLLDRLHSLQHCGEERL